MDTAKSIKDDLFNTGLDNHLEYEWYEAIRWSNFKKWLLAIHISFDNYVFVDAGCGKGRALIFSDRLGFKQSIGIELSEQLFDIAENNIKIYRSINPRRKALQIYKEDASLFTYPDENMVILINNPFTGKTMNTFLNNIIKACINNKKELYLIYGNPICHQVVEEKSEFQLIKILNNCRIYRLSHYI